MAAAWCLSEARSGASRSATYTNGSILGDIEQMRTRAERGEVRVGQSCLVGALVNRPNQAGLHSEAETGCIARGTCSDQ